MSFALLAFTAATANAQKTVYSFQSETWTDDTYGDPYDCRGQFSHVSANGQYAVGCDDQELSASQGGAFLWKRSEPGKINFINTTLNRISAVDVANDGTIVGSFEDRGEDMETNAIAYPGYRTLDGIWTALDVPDNYSLKQAKTNDFMEEARAITPDGKYIAGNVHLVVGSKVVAEQKLEVVYLTPVLWEKNPDGYKLKTVYTGLGAKGKSLTYKDGALVDVADSVNYKQFLVWDISNDGKTIVGVNTADNGGQNPAFIRDGRLVQLYNCDTDTLGEDQEYGNFNGGVCNSIDANGNVYGYYVEADGDTKKNFVYTADGKLEFFDKPVVCATKDGTKLTTSTDGVPYVFDCSEDGQVVAGCGVGANEIGAYTYPMLACDENATSIDRIGNIRNNVSVDYRRGGNLYVNGEYSKATLYDAAGRELMSGVQGQAFNVNRLPGGSYIVKVSTANGEKSFKIAR